MNEKIAQFQALVAVVKKNLNQYKEHEKLQALVILVKERPFTFFVIVPTLIVFLYLILFASDRYESRAKMIIQQPEAGVIDPSSMLLSGLSGSAPTVVDAELVKTFIHSMDMLNYLDDTQNIREHYTNSDWDYFSRLGDDASSESFYDYYVAHTSVEVDSISGIVTLNAQAFDPSYANTLNRAITQKAEEYINSIAHSLAVEQLKFLEVEHEVSFTKLREAQQRLLSFQQHYDLLDPEAEGLAMQQITYNVEGQISAKEAQLNALKSTMTSSASEVIIAQAELDALKQQLSDERGRLANSKPEFGGVPVEDLSVSQILSRYAEYKLDLEMAMQAYSTSQLGIETARVSAIRQGKFLVTVESSTLPDSNQYPEILYNVALLLALLSLLYGITRIILTTIEELG